MSIIDRPAFDWIVPVVYICFDFCNSFMNLIVLLYKFYDYNFDCNKVSCKILTWTNSLKRAHLVSHTSPSSKT